MSSSLDSLTTNLVRGGQHLLDLRNTPLNNMSYSSKREFIHKYMSEWDKFKETKFPPKEAFYSKLNMSGVNSEIMNMFVKFGKNLESKTWENITICT